MDLGMLGDITIDGEKIELTLVFPFPEIPIADYLVRIVEEPIRKPGAEADVKIDVMNDEEKRAFLAMEEESWKGF